MGPIAEGESHMKQFNDSLQTDALGKSGMERLSKLFPSLTQEILQILSDDAVSTLLVDYQRSLGASNSTQMDAGALEVFKKACHSNRQMSTGMASLEKLLDPIDDLALRTLSSAEALHLAQVYREFVGESSQMIHGTLADPDGHSPMRSTTHPNATALPPAATIADGDQTPPADAAATKMPIEPDRWSKVFQRRRYSNVGGWSIGWYVVTYADMAITSGPELISSLLFQLPKGELVEAVEVLQLGSRVRAYIHVRSKGDYHNARGWISLAGNVGSKNNAYTWARRVEAPKKQEKKPEPHTEKPVTPAPNQMSAKSAWSGSAPVTSLGASQPERDAELNGMLHSKMSRVGMSDPALASLEDPMVDHDRFKTAMTNALGINAFPNFRELGSFTGLGLLSGLPGFAIDITGSLRQMLDVSDSPTQTPLSAVEKGELPVRDD